MFSCKAIFFRRGYFLGLWFPFSCISFWVLYVSISGGVQSSDWSKVETSICRHWRDLKSLMHSMYNNAVLRMWLTQYMDTNFGSFRLSFDNKGDVTVEFSYILNIFWKQRCLTHRICIISWVSPSGHQFLIIPENWPPKKQYRWTRKMQNWFPENFCFITYLGIVIWR